MMQLLKLIRYSVNSHWGHRNLNLLLQTNCRTDDRNADVCNWSGLNQQKQQQFIQRGSYSKKLDHSTPARTYTRYAASTIMQHSSENQFRIDDYNVIGFDLDGTLLRYNTSEMIPLEYKILTKFLVECKNYSAEILAKPFNLDLMQKGLILDAEHGNILKLNKDAVIIRATHGTRLLTDDEIATVYGKARKWHVATQFYSDPLSTWNGPLSKKIRAVLDYFDFTVSLVFANTVDIIDKNKGEPLSDYCQLWADVLDGLLLMYARENFESGKSPYFNALREQPERFLLKTNPQVACWLKELRAQGKIIYLLTGSHIDFANFTASYALGEDWKQLFDCVVCFARKPGFFVEQRQFLPIVDNCELADQPVPLDAELALNSTSYSQGNWHQLINTFAKKLRTPVNELSSIYVGDNILQDVYSPVKHHDMDAVAISEEMHEQNSDFPYYNIIKSEFWGSYFVMNDECTLWSSMIEKYAQMCIPTVDALLDEPIKGGVFVCDSAIYYRTKINKN